MWEELRLVNEPGPEGGILKIKTIKKREIIKLMIKNLNASHLKIIIGMNINRSM